MAPLNRHTYGCYTFVCEWKQSICLGDFRSVKVEGDATEDGYFESFPETKINQPALKYLAVRLEGRLIPAPATPPLPLADSSLTVRRIIHSLPGNVFPRAHLHFSHSTHFTLPPSRSQTSLCSATSICFIQYLCGGSTARGEILKVLPTGVIHYPEHFRVAGPQKERCLPIRSVFDPHPHPPPPPTSRLCLLMKELQIKPH